MKTIDSFPGFITLFLFFFLNVLPGSALAVSKAPEPDSAGKARIVENYGKLPLSFEKNQGQTDKKVRFLSRGSGYTLFLAPDEAVLTLSSLLKDEGSGDRQKAAENPKSSVIRMKLLQANSSPIITGQDRITETSNYFIGNDPAKWRTNLSKYSSVRYREVYPGIDLLFYGKQNRLEYDFIVSPGSDPSKIRLQFQGADNLSLDQKGNLTLQLASEKVIQHAPLIYQEVEGRKINIPGKYSIDNQGSIGFTVASYDRNLPLMIDPVLEYSTYLGGGGDDYGRGIAVDHSGYIYVTGYTISSDFPTENALYTNFQGGYNDAFIFKLSPAGSQVVYSTYLGGSGSDQGYGIAVDISGNAYVTGQTDSDDFPVTENALDQLRQGSQDAFIFKLSPAGSQVVYSTYLGGSDLDIGWDIAVDRSRFVYVTGQTDSDDFPVTENALYASPCGLSDLYDCDAFIFKLSPDGSHASYSTYLGGQLVDVGYGIAVDSSGNAYVTGYTYSPDFPTVNALYTNNYGADAFIFKLNSAGSQVVYSTYLGGSDWDVGNDIAVDTSGNAYVTGETGSDDFPVTEIVMYWFYQGGGADAFIFILSPNASQGFYSTYLGGSGPDYGYGIAVDTSGNAYVTGQTGSDDFPVTENALYTSRQGSQDAFIFKFSPAGSQVIYSTYLGGSDTDRGRSIAVDSSGNAYVTGHTRSDDFPVTENALYTNNYGADAFISKISDTLPFKKLTELIETLVEEGAIDEIIENSLISKVTNAQKSIEKGNINAAINQLKALKNQINAQSGKKISEEAADLIIEYMDDLVLSVTVPQ